MLRKPMRSLFAAAGIVVVGGLLACAAYRHQHTDQPAAANDPVAPAPLPATEAFRALSDTERVATLRGQAEETKRALATQGKYSCCVRPACNECLLKDGECHCREIAQKGGPCCGECTGAWVVGRGAIEGITAWEILERKKEMINKPSVRDPAPEKHE